MIDDTPRIRLSEHGSLRRIEMLTELQSELLRDRQSRKRKHALLLLGAAIVLIASNIWLLNWRSDQRHHVVEHVTSVSRHGADQMENQNSERPFEFNHLSFEKISDDELLETLSNMGQPSVLGKIGGETKVVSQLGP